MTEEYRLYRIDSKDLAMRLGMGREEVLRLIKEGRLKTINIGRKGRGQLMTSNTMITEYEKSKAGVQS